MNTTVATPTPEEPEEKPEALTYTELAENFRKGRREALTNVASTLEGHRVHVEVLTQVATAVSELQKREYSRT